jgi:nicotinamidase-related amidase
VLVDFQARLMPAIHQGELVLAQALLLADAARELGVPVLGTEQNPQRLGPNASELRARCGLTLAKTHFDACRDGLAEALLQDRPAGTRPEVVIAGCEAHVCLLQTALGLLERGFTLWVVASACGSRRAEDRQAGLQRLQQAGATLVNAEMVLFEWLGDCRHPRFRPLLERVKAQPL